MLMTIDFLDGPLKGEKRTIVDSDIGPGGQLLFAIAHPPGVHFMTSIAPVQPIVPSQVVYHVDKEMLTARFVEYKTEY